MTFSENTSTVAMTREGLPAAIELGGTSRVTTEPAPTMEFGPITMFGIRIARVPMKQLSLISIMP